jgi:hypothetical protein
VSRQEAANDPTTSCLEAVVLLYSGYQPANNESSRKITVREMLDNRTKCASRYIALHYILMQCFTLRSFRNERANREKT